MSFNRVTVNPSNPISASINGVRHGNSSVNEIPLSPLATNVYRSPEKTLPLLAALAQQHIDGACGASIIVGGERGLDNVGVSAPFVGEVERVQQRLDQGPRIEALRQGDTVLSDSLATDRRWPGFAHEIGELDLGSALVQPLVTPHGVVGTLAVYAYGEGAFDASAVRIAAAFAGPAALAVLVNTSWTPGRGAESAATEPESGVIERALGIMMNRSACSRDRAILRLQKMSQAEHQHLSTMAQLVIDEALVETSTAYVSVREPHRPFGRSAPPADALSTASSSWGRGAEGPLT